MSLCFRTKKIWYEGLVLTAFEEKTAITIPSLCYIQGGVTHYVPLILPNGECYNKEHTVKYSYEPATYSDHKRTICVIYKGKQYVVPNVSQNLKNIPRGSYYGEMAFRTFSNFIAYNSFRVLKKSVRIKHNYITKEFPAGTAVWLTYAYGGKTINLTFTQNKSSMPQTEPHESPPKEWWYPKLNTAPSIQLHNGFRDVWSSEDFMLYEDIIFV